MILRSLLLMVLVLCSIVLQANEDAANNVIKNGGFEQGKQNQAEDWYAGSYGGEQGSWGRESGADAKSGGYYYKLSLKEGKGKLHLLTPVYPLSQADNQGLIFSFRYKGTGVAQLRFYRQDAGRYVPVTTPDEKHYQMTFSLKKSDCWKSFEKKITLAESLQSEPIAIRLRYYLSQPSEEFFLDEVKLFEEQNRDSARINNDWLRIVPPGDLSQQESAGYSAFPDLGYVIGMKDGYFTRDGKPFFYIGSNTVGGGQANISSAWLARVMCHSFCEINRGVGSTMNVAKVDNTLEIKYKDAAASYSVLRELARYHLVSQLDLGNAYYKYIPLKNFVTEFPQLKDFYTDGSHYYGLDHNTQTGREIHFDAWKSIFRYLRNAPVLAFECFNELGYTPTHQRVREGFRVFVRNKYASLETLNGAWGSNFRQWEEIIPPHLAKGSDLLATYSQRLNNIKSCHDTAGYLDWILYLREDLMPGLEKMKEDFRKLSSAPFAVDWRGHQTDLDSYVAVGLEQLEKLVDVFFLHTCFRFFEYNRKPADEASVLTSLTRSVLSHEYVRCNTDKPVFNPEAIHTYVNAPKNELQSMEENSLGKFHGKWKFTLDAGKEGVDKGWHKAEFDDSAWGEMDVPGCWDTTEEYKNKNGFGWYRTSFFASAALERDYRDGSRRYFIVGKGVAQKGTIWVNGEKVGEPSGWNKEYQYDISAFLKYGQKNTVAFRVDGSKHSNGLRFYFFILPNDRMSKTRELEKKEYATILWSNLVHGNSGISLWFWDDPQRLFMSQLASEINSVSGIVMPEARKHKSNIAILLPSISFFGIPYDIENHLDYLSYFGALTFLQARPDVFDESKMLGVTPASHPLVVIPYARTVLPELFAWLKKYVQEGGAAVVTFDSLKQEYNRYSELPIEEFAGVKVTGDLNEAQTMNIAGKAYDLVKGDQSGKFGVSIRLTEAQNYASYGSGASAISVRGQGRGKIYFVAARLNLPVASDLLRKVTGDNQLRLPLTVTSQQVEEFPYIEAGLSGSAERFVLHLFNWGGLQHKLVVKINDERFRKTNYLMRNVRESKGTGRVVTAAELDKGLNLSVNSMEPSVYLFERIDQTPIVLLKISAERQKLLDRLSELRQPIKSAKTDNPKILFVNDIKATPVGKKYFPVVDLFMRAQGCDTESLDLDQFTIDKLKKYKAVFLTEDNSAPYKKIMRSQKVDVMANLLSYVKEGGTLIIVNGSTGHFNASATLLTWFGKKLDFRVTGNYCRNPKACGYGDPLQIKVSAFSQSCLTKNVSNLQLFISRAFKPGAECPLKPVVYAAKDDLVYPSAPLVLAGDVGKGRVLVATDFMWLQPFRIEKEDNAQFLMNVISWSVGREPKNFERQELLKSLPVTDEEMNKIEIEEGLIK